MTVLLILTPVMACMLTGCGGSPLNNDNAQGSEAASPDDVAVYELATIWANSLQIRDGEARYVLMSEAAKDKFEQEQIQRSGEDWNFNIGYSSPWVVDYEIELDGLTAHIEYQSTTSETILYRSSETITFEQVNGNIIVTDYHMNYEDEPVEDSA